MIRPIAYLRHLVGEAREFGQWLIARGREPSTWTGVVGAVIGAKELAEPFSYVAIAAGVIAVLVRRMPGQ
ncbi:MAG: hypothetical protein E6G92_04270 [Alphaproteobacteria bacterium]|nr:MAG: hypothetical protein E6G92_04270 [Alphaproteobacteria bacterium]